MMTLGPGPLKSALRALFAGTDLTAGYPTTADDAGIRWAKIYVDYAREAVAGPTLPVADQIKAAGAVLETALATAFTSALGAAPPHYLVLRDAMVTAFAAFWPSVQFFSPLPPAPPTVTGTVGIPPTTQLSSDLKNFFEARTSSGAFFSGDEQAASLGAILDAWTKTVPVTNTPISGTSTTVLLA